MKDASNKNKQNRRSQTREVLGSKVRLVNHFSLIALTLISVIALWLVSPSRNMLLTLLAESSSPDVALAFLYALDKSVQDDEDIKYLMFKNHLILNNLVKAEAIILPLLKDENGKRNWKAFKKYLQLLLVQYSSADTSKEKDKKRDEIRSLFEKTDYIENSEVALFFADSALAMGFVEKAYQYLLPFGNQQTITNQRELRNLALQFSDYKAALSHQKKIFSREKTVTQFKRLLSLFNSANESEEAYQFIKQTNLNLKNDFRIKKLITSNEFIVLSIEQALFKNDDDFVNTQLVKIVNGRISERYLSRVVDAAIAQNKLESAFVVSERKVLLYPTQRNIKQAHDIAIWLGDIFRALELTHIRVNNNPNESNIRQAIKESIALGDYSSQGNYYRMLANRGFLNEKEFDAYIKIIELTQGSRAAIDVVASLLNKRLERALANKAKLVRSNKIDANLKKLLLHKARLHSYFSEHSVLDEIWLQLIMLESEGAIREITTNEAERFVNSKIGLNRTESALNILLRREDWLEKELNYLQKVFSLAWKMGNKLIAIQALDELMTRTTYDSSSALNGYRYIQLHQPFVEGDIPRLLELSKLWDNDRLLLIAIDLAYNNENYQMLDRLLADLMQDTNYLYDERLLYYAALSAMKQGKPAQVKKLFAQLLINTPKDESIINSYLWWLIDKNEFVLLNELYNKYKIPLKDKMNFWLVFSAASQKLNNYIEAEHWLRKLLVEEKNISVNVILDYAQLMDIKGDKNTAFRLRQYVVNNLSQELFDLDPQHYSFISMVKVFSGERFALPLLENQVVTKPDQRGTIDLFSYYLQRQNYQRLFLFNKNQYLGHFKLPDWQKLSIALLKRDKATIEDLVKNSLQLPIAQKNYAMQKLGETANDTWSNAWKDGEKLLGNGKNERTEKELRNVHIGQHPSKSHGFQIDYSSFSFWDIERVSFRYYQPIKKGWWDLTLLQQNAEPPELVRGSVIDNEIRGLFNLNFKIDWFEPFLHQAQPEILNVKLDLASGVGSVRSGALIGLSMNIDDKLQSYYSLGINQPFEVSQLATLTAKNNQFGIGFNYFPSSRETLSFRMNFNDVTTRFGDDVAIGWDYSIRISEKLFLSDPGWDLYFDLVQQKYKLNDSSLIEINKFFSLDNRIEAIDLIDKEFVRVAIGQRFFNGNPGQPGAVKGSPRYWLETSIGFNPLNKKADLALSSGLGWHLFGDDELSLKLDWQSSDINGDESLKFSLGYYYNL